MTRFKKIKAKIVDISIEDMADIYVSNDMFSCPDCDAYAEDPCDSQCKNHCIDWLNSEAPDE